MNMDTVFCIVAGLLVSSCLIAMAIKDVKETNRKAPYGKVFVKEFVEMVDDIKYALVHNSLPYLFTTVNKRSFRVSVKEEAPYDGLEYETIPVYKSFAIYIDDEIVCRVHRIKHYYKDHPFVEFSSKRDRDEVIEIIKEAYIEAKEHNHAYVSKLFSKFDSKSFYQDYSHSED